MNIKAGTSALYFNVPLYPCFPIAMLPLAVLHIIAYDLSLFDFLQSFVYYDTLTSRLVYCRFVVRKFMIVLFRDPLIKFCVLPFINVMHTVHTFHCILWN